MYNLSGTFVIGSIIIITIVVVLSPLSIFSTARNLNKNANVEMLICSMLTQHLVCVLGVCIAFDE